MQKILKEFHRHFVNVLRAENKILGLQVSYIKNKLFGQRYIYKFQIEQK